MFLRGLLNLSPSLIVSIEGLLYPHTSGSGYCSSPSLPVFLLSPKLINPYGSPLPWYPAQKSSLSRISLISLQTTELLL